MWDKSTAWVRSSQLQADATWVVLSHGEAHADIQVSIEHFLYLRWALLRSSTYMGGP